MKKKVIFIILGLLSLLVLFYVANRLISNNFKQYEYNEVNHIESDDTDRGDCPIGYIECCGDILDENGEPVCNCYEAKHDYGIFGPCLSDKPIIYIYPEKEIEVEIKVSNPEKFMVTYPIYNNGWKFKVTPDSTITLDDKQYYSLYWEGYNSPKVSDYYGFVVEKDNLAEFLDDKLSILGLNWRERNEFIIYWLPQLMNNDYTFITFADMKDIDDYMKLDINPQPETLIRVFMHSKEVDKNYKYEEQILTPVERTGYTVVEWGGSIEN